MDDEFCAIGYIRAKFKIEPEEPGKRARIDQWADQFKSTRRTNFFVYVQLGHSELRDNDHGRRIVREIKALGGKITRVDFAVDIAESFDFDAYKAMMDEKYKHQTMEEKIGLPQLYTSLEGVTVYVGKRPSARFFRAYDKAAEIKARHKVDIDMALTRFEIECKRNVVPLYLGLFMAGNTKAIVDDMSARYHLPNLSDNPKRVLPTEDDQNKCSIWAWVHRYRRIIREAYTTDKEAFLDIINER